MNKFKLCILCIIGILLTSCGKDTYESKKDNAEYHKELCPECHGRGRIKFKEKIWQDCGMCFGNGVVYIPNVNSKSR